METNITTIAQNFGKIKTLYNNILVESIVNKKNDNKGVFKKYVKTLNENKILKNQFLIYNLIENKIEPNEMKAKLFIDECINYFSKYNKNEILNENSKLIQDLIFESDVIDYDKKELHENITNLIFTNKTPDTIDTIVESTTYLINYVMTNKEKEINESYGYPNSLLASLATDEFNEEYSNISEDEKNIISRIMESNSDETKENLLKEYNSQCIKLIDESLLNESDDSIKDKLSNVKDKLLNQTYNTDTFTTDINKLLTLKESLKF
jgi:hypothetical protein